MAEVILPGTYVTVKDEGLIAAGRVATGNIGIVGTAEKGPMNKVQILGSFSEAKDLFGEADEWQNSGKELTLVRSLEHIYANGGKTVYAVRVGEDKKESTDQHYKDGLILLENELVNIVLIAGQDVSNNTLATALKGHLKATAEIKRERIGLVGSDGLDSLDAIKAHKNNSDRLIFVAPGIISQDQKLPGSYTAAAIAGLIASLPVQTSPTNKVLTIEGVSKRYTSSQLEALVNARVMAVEERNGYKVVKGITTATNSAWHQITTRRIVDYAIYGVRSGADPYIGKLNNERVRGAMKATLDAFLTRMVENEALISYELEVTATRAQQIAGEAIVTMKVRPTFSIDFIKVTMYLE